MSDLRDGLDEFDEMENEAKEAATVSAERDYIDRTIATVRQHKDSDNSWPQWANALADEVARLTAERDEWKADCVRADGVIQAERAENERLVAASQELIDSMGIELDDVRLDYIVAQVDRLAYDTLRAILAALTPQADAAGGERA